jgi:hypothetical protein
MTKRHDVRVGSRAPENGGPAPFSRPASCAVIAPPVYPTWAPSVSSHPTIPIHYHWPALSLSIAISAPFRSGGHPACRGAGRLALRNERLHSHRAGKSQRGPGRQDAALHGRRDARRHVGTPILPAFSQGEKEIGRPAACPSQAPRHYAIPHARLLLPKGEGRKVNETPMARGQHRDADRNQFLILTF